MIRDREQLAEAEADQQELNVRHARCPRFGDVDIYLRNNRYELALDTTTRPMGEHILYNHILKNGSLELTAEEWHNFLLICHRRQILFRYRIPQHPGYVLLTVLSSYLELGPAWGVINRINSRWPRTNIRDRPVPVGGQQSNSAVTALVEHMYNVLESDGVFNFQYNNHDYEDFRVS